MRKLRTSIALLIAVGTLHAQTQSPEPPKPSTISLTVVDSVTQLPIAGAKASLADPVGRFTGLVTDATGEVTFTGLAPGRYLLSSLSASRYIYSPGTFPSLTLHSDEHRNLGVIPIDPLGTMSGTIVDGDGKPLERVAVEALLFLTPSNVRGSTVYTDAEGKYKFESLQPGRHVVRVSSNTYLQIPTSYYPNADSVAHATRVNVAPGRESDRIDFIVRRTSVYHIHGIVEGLPDPSKSTVNVQPCTAATFTEMFVKSNSVSVHPDGTFDAEVFPGDHCLQVRQGGSDQIFLARATVRVTDRDVTNIRLFPIMPTELTGVIKLQQDAGLSMPQVVPLLPVANVTQPPPADVQPDGSFRFTNVLPIDYHLLMNTGGGYIKSLKLGGLEMSDGHVNMESGGSPLVIEIAAARGRAKVKVNIGSAKPTQTIVVLSPTGSAGLRSDLVKIAPTNDQGELTMDAIAPGLYKAYAFADPDQGLLKTPGFLDLFQATTVRISDTEEPNVELRLIPRSEFDDAKGLF